MQLNLDKINVRKRHGEWNVWIPPTKPEHYEGEDQLAPYGDTFWPSFTEAIGFVRLVQGTEK